MTASPDPNPTIPTNSLITIKPANYRRNAKGRPSSFTPQKAAIIIDYVQRGAYTSVAARAAGVEPSTVINWLQKGRALYEEHGHLDVEELFTVLPRDLAYLVIFASEMGKAESSSIAHASDSVVSAFEKDWRAAAEFLKMRWPEKYSPKRIEVMSGEVLMKVADIVGEVLREMLPEPGPVLEKIAERMGRLTDDE